MKNKEEIEIAEVYFERHPLILTFWLALTTLSVVSCVYIFMYEDFYMHGYALVVAPVALFSVFQTLQILLNPYALIFKERLEIKKNMFSNKQWYFIDIKKVSDVNNGTFNITYNDDEQEKFILKGIKPSHINNFQIALTKKIKESLVSRSLTS